MTALAIALHVLAAAAGAPALHLETPVGLRLEAADLAPPGALTVERHVHVLGVRPGAWAAAAGATALGDAAVAGLFVLGAGSAVRGELGGGSGAGGMVLAGTAVIAYLLAPPAFAVWGAERAGAPRGRHGEAYAKGMLARLLGAGAAYALGVGAQSIARSDGPDVDGRPILVGALAVSELIVMPWVVARTLGDGPEPETPEGGADAPSTRARPVRDPALALR